MRTKFEVRSFTCSWDNRGYPQNLAFGLRRAKALG